jgi:large subunit ribosomal protein L15
MQSSKLDLSLLRPATGSKKKRKRIGFGSGSGSGKTAGKGHKGQTARAGGRIPRGFEGGQMPLHRRLPKTGFISRKKVRGENQYSVVSLDQIAALEEKTISADLLREYGLVGNRPQKVKILAGKAFSKAVTLEVNAISASAREAVEKAGGTVTLLS